MQPTPFESIGWMDYSIDLLVDRVTVDLRGTVVHIRHVLAVAVRVRKVVVRRRERCIDLQSLHVA